MPILEKCRDKKGLWVNWEGRVSVGNANRQCQKLKIQEVAIK